MPETLRCPACGSHLPDAGTGPGEGVFCVACGMIVRPQVADWNPYAAPSADLAERGEETPRPSDIPRSWIGKLALTFGLLGANLPLFGLIVLTVWLPANALIMRLLGEVPEERQQVVSSQLNSMIQALCGPLVVGAVTFAAARRLDGRRVGYGEAMATGLRNWGRLFVANFLAGIRILVGFIALIIPGIVLSIRYSLIGPAVVLEGSSSPRERSRELTDGRGWSIFLATSVVYALSILLVWGASLAAEQVEALDSLAWAIASDCLVDLCNAAVPIAMVVFYTEARRAEIEAAEVADDPLSG